MDDRTWDRNRIAERLRALVRGSASDEMLGNALADEIELDAQSEKLSSQLQERMRAAAERGMFDGQVARGRVRMRGTLGGFGSALRRIREAAGVSLTQMAERAGVTRELWDRLESHRGTVATLDVPTLASVVEAAQLRLAEVADILHRTDRLHVASVGPASFRVDEDARSDAAAAYDDLVSAIAEGERRRRGEEASGQDFGNLIEGLREELRRRGREDLL